MGTLICRFCLMEMNDGAYPCAHTPATYTCPHCAQCACALPETLRSNYRVNLERTPTFLEQIWLNETPQSMPDAPKLQGIALQRLQSNNGNRIHVLGVEDDHAFAWVEVFRPGLRKEILGALLEDGITVRSVRVRQVPLMWLNAQLKRPYLYFRGDRGLEPSGRVHTLSEEEKSLIRRIFDPVGDSPDWRPIPYCVDVVEAPTPPPRLFIRSGELSWDLKVLGKWLAPNPPVVLVPQGFETEDMEWLTRQSGLEVRTPDIRDLATYRGFIHFVFQYQRHVPYERLVGYRVQLPGLYPPTPFARFHLQYQLIPNSGCGDKRCLGWHLEARIIPTRLSHSHTEE